MAIRKVDWTANALAMVFDIFEYLEMKQGDSFASDYIDSLLEFGNSLDKKSEHHAYCRHQILQKKEYRCAQFRKTYLIIYKIINEAVVILGVIHVSRNPKVFDDL